MPESLAITRLLNHIFAGPVDALLQTVHVHPVNPAAPINNTFSVELLVVVGFIALFALVRCTLSVEKPGTPQQFAEMIHEFIGGMAEQSIGHGYQHFEAFVVCIFLFVLTCNLIGLIPGINAPTMSPYVPLGLATSVFIYYNFHGVRQNGPIGYLKEFAGPVWWIAWLMFPIELVSHCARLLSLTVRLWANMFAGDLVTMVFFSLFPFAFTIPFICLHIFVSIVQALVFSMLAMIYLGQAVAHEH